MADSFLVRQSRVFLGDRLTPMGRMVFYLTIPGIGLGTTSLGIKVYVVGLALLCLLGCSVVAARLSRVPLAVRLFLPPRATRGQPFQIQATLRNQTQRKARDLQLRLEDLPLHFKVAAQPPGQLPGRFDLGDLYPGRETKWNWEIVSQKRGPCTVRTVRLATLFPFNLWSDWYDCPVASSILIYPSFTALETLDIPVGRRYQPGGIALSSNLGDSTEFMSTREFRLGDSLRSIHWRSWARTGKPIVKEFQEEFFCRIALVLDTFVESTAPRSK